MAGSSGSSSIATAVDCLPAARQGAAAVSWNGSVLLVGGSTSPGGGLPPYTEWPTVFRGELTTAGGGGGGGGARWAWRPFATLPNGLTHAAAVAMDDVLYVMGGYGLGSCLHSPSKGKCAHSSVWALDLRHPQLPAHAKAPMPFNRSNFGSVVHSRKIYTAGGYGNFGLLGGSAPCVGGSSGGGARASGNECVRADVDVYDPVSDKWSSLKPMAVARGGFNLGSVITPAFPGGLIYAVGGFHCVNGPVRKSNSPTPLSLSMSMSSISYT